MPRATYCVANLRVRSGPIGVPINGTGVSRSELKIIINVCGKRL